MSWQDYLQIALTINFQNSLKNCACNTDTEYKKQFNFFYSDLIDSKIVLPINNYWVFNHPDKFIANKDDELVTLLNKYDFEVCTKKRILEFYKSETETGFMGMVLKKKGEETRGKKAEGQKNKRAKKRRYINIFSKSSRFMQV
jgi:hypothetical protein